MALADALDSHEEHSNDDAEYEDDSQDYDESESALEFTNSTSSDLITLKLANYEQNQIDKSRQKAQANPTGEGKDSDTCQETCARPAENGFYFNKSGLLRRLAAALPNRGRRLPLRRIKTLKTFLDQEEEDPIEPDDEHHTSEPASHVTPLPKGKTVVHEVEKEDEEEDAEEEEMQNANEHDSEPGQ
ncbi:unnamed protein product [Echinostoma caproni]|uniref:Histone H3.v1-like n=1 Tax=Echinostoma caproni TaxID=27848 RepID=A0A183AJ92_9TREM|nr:unnamed protein product [Echinostoma caproni]